MHIVIVGGGIAGLATAAFLRERTNFKIEVFERSGSIKLDQGDENEGVPKKGDYGIAIAPNGIACLDKLGMNDPVKELNGSELGQILLRDSHNPSDVEAQKYEFRQLFGFPSIFCRRSALIIWLTKKCIETRSDGKQSVIIRNYCKTIKIDAMQGKVELVDLKHSPNLIEYVEADLLICADGIAKVGRQAVLQAQEKLKNKNSTSLHSSSFSPIEQIQSEKILQFSFMSIISPESLQEREKLRFLLDGMGKDVKDKGKCTLANFYHEAPYRGMNPEQILDALQKHKRILLYPVDHNGYHQLFAYGAMNDEILARFGRGPLARRSSIISTTSSNEESSITFTDSSTDSTPLTSPIRSTSHKIPRGSILHGTSTKEAFEIFKMFSPELSTLLLLNGEEEGIDLCLVRDSDPIDIWSVNGKTVLIGDAAHASVPHTGQGSSQAMEDAETLSYVLSKFSSSLNLKEILQTFENVRIPIAHKAQITARMANGHLPGLEKMDLEKYNREILAWKSTEIRLEEMKKVHEERKKLNPNSTLTDEEPKRSKAVSVQ